MESEIVIDAIKLKREAYRVELRKKGIKEILNTKRVVSSEINASDVPLKIIDNNPSEPLQKACNMIINSKKEQNFDKIIEGLSSLAHLFILESKNIPIKETLRTGVGEVVIGFIQEPSVMNSTCEALANSLQIIVDLLSGDLEDVLVLVSLNLIDALIDVFSVSTTEDIQRMVLVELKKVLLAFYNITLDHHEDIRRQILSDKFVSVSIDFYKKGPKYFLIEELLAIILNLTYENSFIDKLNRFMPILCALLHHDETKILIKVLKCLSNLTNTRDDQIDRLFAFNVTHILISTAQAHSDANVRIEALKVICNVLSGENINTEKIIDEGLLCLFYRFLKEEKVGEKAVELIAWGVTNLMSCKGKIIDRVIKDQTIMMFYPVFFSSNLKIRSEYIYGLKQFSKYCNYAQLIKYADYGNLFKALVESLEFPGEAMVINALKAIKNCLELGKEIEIVTDENPILVRLDRFNIGLILDKLQTESQNPKIVNTVQSIISEYYLPSSEI